VKRKSSSAMNSRSKDPDFGCTKFVPNAHRCREFYHLLSVLLKVDDRFSKYFYVSCNKLFWPLNVFPVRKCK
jgi:hypothetical protein